MKTEHSKSIFRSVNEHGKRKVPADTIEKNLLKAGIAIDDARLAGLRSRLDTLGKTEIDAREFDELLDSSGSLVARAVKGELIIPEFDRFSRRVRAICEQVKENKTGDVADYIPQLGRIDPAYFRTKFDADILLHFGPALEKLQDKKMLTVRNGSIRLSREGLLRVDSLLPEFYDPKYQNARYT